ncbi:MAG: asparagine synthetase B family protein [Chloroflexi bacterium]|nr:MAG: asparagine synthetase B family protein [Chloroflexota bacterium]
MANFVIIVDPDTERRTRFVETIKPLLPPVDGLQTTTEATGDFCAVWASREDAPVSRVADGAGAAVIWGEAIPRESSERLDAARLRDLWREDPALHRPPPLEGFHAAVAYRPGSGVVVGADLLGLFPVYHYAAGEVLLVGSSPELFRHHPAFRAGLDLAGLVGILLTMHSFDGRTLLQGVRRLAAGHLLVWRPGSPPREVQQYAIPVSDRYAHLPFRAHVALLHQVLDEAVARHAPGSGRYSLLLSGGLDSRMLAGYLRRNGVAPVALTLGLPTDIEMRCAIPVARTLGLDHRGVDIAFEQYPRCADLQARWEHLTNGFNDVMHWGIYPHLRGVAPRVITGYLMDAIVGGSHITWAYSPANNAMTFERFFDRINRWGIRPGVLQRLLRREVFGDLVQETIARIREVYQSYADRESQRAWCFDLHHRQRFHVGGGAWALSFGAWPVLPAVDHRVLETVGAMPAATLADRHAQQALLCRRFPRLARLPLDRNAYDTEPLRPRLRYLLVKGLSRQLGLHRLRRVWERRNGERRYYYRIYDINGPGWVAVRRGAEPHRERVLHLFHPEVLAEVLPAPDQPLPCRDGIIDASGAKTLLGFLLWARDHL